MLGLTYTLCSRPRVSQPEMPLMGLREERWSVAWVGSKLFCSMMRMSSVILATLLAVIYVVSCKTSVNRKIMMVTYNVNEKPPKEDLSNLLFTPGLPPKNENMPDFYAIGLQETPLKFQGKEPWSAHVRNALEGYSYYQVKEIKLMGILLVIMAKRELKDEIRNFETGFKRTGFGGLWGNKGGVAVRFTIGDTSICIVNSHLAAHHEFFSRRIQEYTAIVNRVKFPDKSKILDNDYVLWMGDLNFRLDNVTTQEVIGIVSKSPSATSSLLKPLLVNDQLTLVRNDKRAFGEFQESPITFMPTFKFVVGSDEYNPKRTPAWTDRVMYRVGPKDGLAAKQLTYTSHPLYKTSDHKPVTSIISIDV